MTRRGIATFRCRLCDQPEGKTRDIPQWMFDASVCSQMRMCEQLQVSLFALKSLASLLTEINTGQNHCLSAVVEDRHFQTEHGDAEHETTISFETNQIPNSAVRDATESASLGEPSTTSETRSQE